MALFCMILPCFTELLFLRKRAVHTKPLRPGEKRRRNSVKARKSGRNEEENGERRRGKTDVSILQARSPDVMSLLAQDRRHAPALSALARSLTRRRALHTKANVLRKRTKNLTNQPPTTPRTDPAKPGKNSLRLGRRVCQISMQIPGKKYHTPTKPSRIRCDR